MKTCSKCDEAKALTEFYKSKKGRDGLRGDCKSCVYARAKAYREANPEKVKAREKAYREANLEKVKARSKAYREANLEKVKAREKAYREANLEKVKAREKAYREANSEKIKASDKVWCEANPEKVKARNKAYYEANSEKEKARKKAYRETPEGRLSGYRAGAKERNIPFLLAEEEFKSFWQLPCRYCGAEIKSLGLDRVDNDGPYRIDNVAPCCWPCNRDKGSKTLKEWTEITLKRAKMSNPEEHNE